MMPSAGATIIDCRRAVGRFGMFDIRFHHREWVIFKRGCSICSGTLRHAIFQDQQYNGQS